jgi:hypothetical protein
MPSERNSRGAFTTLLRAKPPKGGDAEPRDYGGTCRYVRRAASETCREAGGWRPCSFSEVHERQMNRRSSERNWSRDRDNWHDERGRSPQVERLERDSFILLQHVYTLTGANCGAPVNAGRAGADLGFAQEETSRLVWYLSWVGYMKESAAGPHLSIAEEGIDYLERGAGRRHSVRCDEKDIPIPVFMAR